MLKDKLTPTQLSELMYGKDKLSIIQIAARYGVTRQRVYQLLNAYREIFPMLFQQPSKPSKADQKNTNFVKDELTKEVLQQLVRDNKSDDDIAKLYQCSTNTVKQLRSVHSVYRR